MGKIPDELREIIARNILDCRMEKYPGRGDGKKCAEAFHVSPQQWSPWESGKRTPDEERLAKIAEFFGKTVEYMRMDNQPVNANPPPADDSIKPREQRLSDGCWQSGQETSNPPGKSTVAPPGSAESFFTVV